MPRMPPRKLLPAFRPTPITWCWALLLVVLCAELSASTDKNPFDDPGFKRAVVAYSENRLEEAEALFQELTQKFPENAAILNNLAVIAIRRNSTARAITLLKSTLATDSVLNTAYNNLSAVYAYLASVSYREALSLESLDPKPLQLKLIDKAMPDAPPPVADAAALALETPEVDVPLVRDPETPATENADQSIMTAVTRWAQAWSRQDLDAYFLSYIDGYAPPGNSHQGWKAQRTERILNPRFIDVTVSDIRTSTGQEMQAQVIFKQKYRSNILSSLVTKQLSMRNINDKWKITGEKIL